jgi:Spy/CpxP family protein refolding chaperone
LGFIYTYLKRSRTRNSKIKGYLDLIPDLREEQRAQVQEIRKVFLPKVEGIRQNLRSKRAQLAELLFEEPPNRSMIHTIAEQIMAQQSELEKEVLEHILEERELLSPAQKRRFYEIIVEQFSSGGLGVHDVRARH